MTGNQPNLSHLRIFGARVHLKKTGRRKAKLDSNNSIGTFVSYGGTDKNVYVIDKQTGREKLTTHVIYDEAYMSAPTAEQPPMAAALQQAGDKRPLPEPNPDPRAQLPTMDTIKCSLLSPDAIMPTRGTKESAGLDMYSSENAVIPPNTTRLIDTDIAIKLQPGTYGQIHSQSSLAVKEILAVGGVIDSDYRGPIKIILHNSSDTQFQITKGTRIAQLIIHEILTPVMKRTHQLSETVRGQGGFGSTNTERAEPEKVRQNDIPTTEHLQPQAPSATDTPRAPQTQPSDDTIHYPSRGRPTYHNRHPHIRTISPEPDHSRINKLQQDLNTEARASCLPEPQNNIEIPYQIRLTDHPYENFLQRTIQLRRNDPTEGLDLIQCPIRNLPMIKTIRPGTATAKLPKWRRTLKQAYLHKIDDVPMTTVNDVHSYFAALLPTTMTVTLTVATLRKSDLHPDDGVPLLYFDQLNTIGKHLKEIKQDEQPAPHDTATQTQHIQNNEEASIQFYARILRAASTRQPPKAIKGILPKSKQRSTKLTRRKLMKLDTWDTWQQSEYKQLQQYEDQSTFGAPGPLPDKANCLDLLWTYNVKDDGTHKARCVCNGRPNNPGTVTWGYTYAKSLDQVGNRVFWAVAALRNYIVRGSDASNAFAEADPPKHPLYVTIDAPFRDWWASKNRPPIPKHHVLKVQKALQGHPESPRLWANLIHKIITKHIGLKSTTHEPCLYSGTYKGKDVMFLRQVDDFAVAAKDEDT